MLEISLFFDNHTNSGLDFLTRRTGGFFGCKKKDTFIILSKHVSFCLKK